MHFLDLCIYMRRQVRAQSHCEPMAAFLRRCLCVHYPDAPLVCGVRVVQLSDGVGQAHHEVIEGHCSCIPFFCSLMSLIDSGVSAHEEIDFLLIKNSIVIRLAKSSVPAPDAVKRSVVFKLAVEPAVAFRERYVAQRAGGIGCNVTTCVEWLVAAVV